MLQLDIILTHPVGDNVFDYFYLCPGTVSYNIITYFLTSSCEEVASLKILINFLVNDGKVLKKGSGGSFHDSTKLTASYS